MMMVHVQTDQTSFPQIVLKEITELSRKFGIHHSTI